MVTISNVDRENQIFSGSYLNSREGCLILKNVIEGLMYILYGKHGDNIFDNWERVNISHEYDNTLKAFVFQVPAY